MYHILGKSVYKLEPSEDTLARFTDEYKKHFHIQGSSDKIRKMLYRYKERKDIIHLISILGLISQLGSVQLSVFPIIEFMFCLRSSKSRKVPVTQ